MLPGHYHPSSPVHQDQHHTEPHTAMPPPGMPNSTMHSKIQTIINSSDITSIEGKDLGELKKLWKDIAASEVRLKLMSELKRKKIGFNEIEQFSLGLQYDFKSEKWKKKWQKTY